MYIRCEGLGRVDGDGHYLLRDVTLTIPSGAFVGIIGPSGAGKSTLLAALCGVRPASMGTVYYDGEELYSQLPRLRHRIGYVPQDDIVPIELSVGQALFYSAQLRLPAGTTAAEVQARIEDVLERLKLTECRERPIRHLSGGQRKRVSIAAELVADPTVLFLDEPTAALDPALEHELLDLFRELAKPASCTVIMVTHGADAWPASHWPPGRSPSCTVIMVTHGADAVVGRCDLLAVVEAGGRLASLGSPQQLLAHYALDLPAHESPWPMLYQRMTGAEAAGRPDRSRHGEHQLRPSAGRHRPVSAVGQWWILAQRYWETVAFSEPLLITWLGQAVVIATIVVAVFQRGIFDMQQDVGDNVAVKKALFLVALAAVWLGTSNASREIVKEAAIYARERHAGLNPIAYLGSKFAVLMSVGLGQCVVLLLALLLIGANRSAWPMLLTALFLASLAGTTMGLIISAASANPDRANIIVPLALLPQIIFSGFFVDLAGVGWLEVISHLTVTKWTYYLLGAALNVDDIPYQVTQPTRDFGYRPWLLAGFSLWIIIISLIGLALALIGRERQGLDGHSRRRADRRPSSPTR